jgi:hypothetical protein
LRLRIDLRFTGPRRPLPVPAPCARGRLARLGNTHVAGHLILFHLVDHDFPWLARAVHVEKDRLIDAAVPLFHPPLIHHQREVALIFLWIGAAQFDRNIFYLLEPIPIFLPRS